MSQQLFDQLNALDRGIAAAYQKAVGARFSGPINENEADTIFQKAIDGDRITPREAEALYLIIDQAWFTPDAEDHLLERIGEQASRDALYLGSGRLLLKDAELAVVYSALGMGAVSSITFQSPGTKIHYGPEHYQAVKRLVADGDILVFEVDAWHLRESAGLAQGSYGAVPNHLFYYKAQPPADRVSTIVHECTHAIQDWMDIKSLVKCIEADAFVAGATAYHDVGGRLGDGTAPLQVAFHEAVPVVVKGKATAGNHDWKRAYQKVVEAVEGAYDNADDESEKKLMGELHGERAHFNILLGALKKKRH